MSGWGVPNLENTFTQLSRAAKDIGTHLGSGLNSVAENLEGAFIQIGEGTAERAGCVRRGSSTEEEQVEDLEEGGGGGGGGGGEAEGSERERVLLNQELGGGMGCGSSYSAYIPQPSSTQVDNMLCDMCQARLNFIKRKKVCSECCNCFCSTCLPSENGKSTRTCARCKVLERKPGERTELMKLRVKDLQLYLSRRQINIKACVEKKDLVELVIETNGDGGERRKIRPTSPPSNPSWQDPSIRVSDQVPLERASNFPKSYTESSHRREWFEKFDGETADIPVDSETFVTGPESSAVGTLSVDTLDESVMEALPVEDSTILVETLNSPGEEEGEEVLQEKYQGLSEQPPIEEDDYIGE
ncbi:E3 ubiquitin-protein ligase RNF34 [Eurytemora carolleeae]|uniref:E3 ubiquitin-protein ligase RNF34 n=1 Tax=Eurytemora carolleeae TaxID=1294199 RepID=UPI000C78033E|nr:E3 ubiquitin-protein ligase RNF34 [Eurytemora carolleeae]|eukprot:XP_023343870.1 E3 ubiquitin-protein ligase RNF34-like [Eurytemora affinis]